MKIDVKRGAVGEAFVDDHFTRQGWTIKKAKGFVPAYDRIITRGRVSLLLEIKSDYKSYFTRNYAIEKATLDHTKSDYWIHLGMNPDGTVQDAYILPMETVRQLYKKYPKQQTGDFEWNVSALVPKDVFANYQRL